MPYTTGTATGHEDLLEKFRRWVCGYGTAAAAVAGSNTGNGTVTGIDTTPDTITETWTLTCTAGGPTGTFSVVGSVSGAEADATVGTAYSNDFISFLINDGAADFIIGDSFTIAATIGAMSSAGYAWQQNTLASDVLIGAAWTRSSTTFTVTLNGHTLAIGDTVDTSSISTSGEAPATKTITATGASTISFTGASTNAGLSWTRSGTVATVTWTGHGFSTGNSMTVSASSATGTITNGAKTLTVVDANTFTFSCTNTGATSGTLTGTLPTSGTMTISLNETHLYLKGLGNGGTDEIFVQMRSYQNTGGGYYNIELRGATGFTGGIGATRLGQAGISELADISLWSSTIPYWFIANGRRFMIVAKVGTVYESCYAGFILPTGLPSEYPYPLAIGGSQSLTRKKYDFSSSAYSHRAFFSTGGGSGETGALFLRELSGSWSAFKNYANDNGQYVGNIYRTFPYAASFHSPSGVDKPIYPNIDGSYTLFPITLLGRVSNSNENIFGDFEGVKYVSGQGNASENIVQVDGVDHLVVQNIFRTDAGNYAAFALE